MAAHRTRFRTAGQSYTHLHLSLRFFLPLPSRGHLRGQTPVDFFQRFRGQTPVDSGDRPPARSVGARGTDPMWVSLGQTPFAGCILGDGPRSLRFPAQGITSTRLSDAPQSTLQRGDRPRGGTDPGEVRNPAWGQTPVDWFSWAGTYPIDSGRRCGGILRPPRKPCARQLT